MIHINIVFDEEMDDVDIIALPENIFRDIASITRQFMDWLPDAPKDNSDYWAHINGKSCLTLETDGFVKWLNQTYCLGSNEAFIVEQHTKYHPEYQRIDF